MSKKILWKTLKELNEKRDADALLIGLFDIGGRKIIHTFKYHPGNVNHYQEERELLIQNVTTDADIKKSQYVDYLWISKENLALWCYFDEFMAGAF